MLLKKILMVVYSYSPMDPRPRREADALINAGYQVDMICLKKADQAAKGPRDGSRDLHR